MSNATEALKSICVYNMGTLADFQGFVSNAIEAMT